nr:hypothetical protein [Tamaricihabitans halophyticus]
MADRPFDPPHEIRAEQVQGRLTRVRIRDLRATRRAYADRGFFQARSTVMVSMTLSAEQRDSAVQELNEYLDELANKEIADPSDDLISSLVNRITAGELTRTEAAQLGVLLLVGGHETTANMIVLGTLALFEHPEQLATLRHA